MRGFMQSRSSGTTVMHLKTSEVPDFEALLPPLSVQKRIVDLIASVDAHIEALQQQLELAKRARAAILRELLTAGGNDSWETRELQKVCTKFGAGPFGSNMKVSTFVQEGIPVISGNHMSELELVEKSFNFITEAHANALLSSVVQRNDVVITKAGTIGQVSLIPNTSKYGKYVLSSRQLFVRPDVDVVIPKYLAIFLKYGSGQDQILSNVNRTGVPSLSQAVAFIKRVKVMLPPLAEQRKIVDLISTIDSYIETIKDQVSSSTGLRSGLLSDLLSGEHEIPSSYDQLIGANG